jgi:hypothetical protein
VELKLSDWILPVLVLAIWVPSWWLGTRRFRLWFALLAPWACVLGISLGLVLELSGVDSQVDTCTSSCAGGAVQRWAATIDSPPPSIVWLQTSSLLALAVAAVLTVLTLIVEYVLLVLRDSRAARSRRREGVAPPPG